MVQRPGRAGAVPHGGPATPGDLRRRRLAFSSLPGILADHLGGYLPAYLLFTTINVLVPGVCIALSYRAVKTCS